MDTEKELSLLPLLDPEFRRRARALLESKKGRKKFLDSLHHDPRFDSRYVYELPYEESWPDAVLGLLVARGAPKDCYVISTHSEHDGATVRLDEAVQQLCGHGDGTILLCILGRLAYYEGEMSLGGCYKWIVECPA